MAIDAPRWRVTSGLKVACEASMDHHIVKRLEIMGHQITLLAPDNAAGFRDAQLILKMETAFIWVGQSREKMGVWLAFNKLMILYKCVMGINTFIFSH